MTISWNQNRPHPHLVVNNGFLKICILTYNYFLAINGEQIFANTPCFSLGHSFHIAAQLGGDVTAVFNRIEDAVVQSDEVDGKYLQFEGGLSITGIYICYCIGNIALQFTR